MTKLLNGASDDRHGIVLVGHSAARLACLPAGQPMVAGTNLTVSFLNKRPDPLVSLPQSLDISLGIQSYHQFLGKNTKKYWSSMYSFGIPVV